MKSYSDSVRHPFSRWCSMVARALLCGVRVAGLALGLAGCPTSVVWAQQSSWPNKPVTLIVPIAAGGGTDLISRAVAEKLQALWKQPIIVKNLSGANGTVGTLAAARAEADGYTLLIGSQGTFGVNTCLYQLPYDAEKDFNAVALIATFNSVFIVSAESPITSLQDLVNKARAEPGKLTYGITVIGSSAHLGVELFKAQSGIDILGIPYNGAKAALVDFFGGRIDFMLDAINSQYGNIASGKVRALATTAGLARSSVLPTVPTTAEAGFPGFDAVGWAGIFVPTGVSAQITEKIARSVVEIYQAGDLQAGLGKQGYEFVSTNSAEFSTYVTLERKKWCDLVAKAKIKLN